LILRWNCSSFLRKWAKLNISTVCWEYVYNAWYKQLCYMYNSQGFRRFWLYMCKKISTQTIFVD
jgi:hypothetical protein